MGPSQSVSPSFLLSLAGTSVRLPGKMVNDTNSNSNPELATLKQLRERLGMTQEELATELGTTSRTIRRHETGEREIRFSLPQIKRLIELMQRAGMSSDDLPDDIK
jgi:DNA-binding XRE family transcriptional regulator